MPQLFGDNGLAAMLLQGIEIAEGDTSKEDAALDRYVPRIADRMQGGEGRPLSTEQLGGISDELRAALEKAQKSADHTKALEALAPYIPKTAPALVDLVEASKDKQPEPLIRRQGSLLSVGEILVLAGAGGAGKSTLALQIALTATKAKASSSGEDVWGEIVGLMVKGCPVVVISFEDRRWRVWDRARKIAEAAQWDAECVDSAMQRIGVAEATGFPLFGVEDGGHIGQAPAKLKAWRPLWDQVARRNPGLVVIDPALSAYTGDDARVSAVRAFLDALRVEAEGIGCGVVLVAHTTKAARGKNDPSDPGNISGSAAWTDAARAALVLHSEKPKDSPMTWKLESVKTNYAAPVELALQGKYRGEALAGFELVTAPTQTKGKADDGLKTNTHQGGEHENWA